jgi:hypothetical protein
VCHPMTLWATDAYRCQVCSLVSWWNVAVSDSRNSLALHNASCTLMENVASFLGTTHGSFCMVQVAALITFVFWCPPTHTCSYIFILTYFLVYPNRSLPQPTSLKLYPKSFCLLMWRFPWRPGVQTQFENSYLIWILWRNGVFIRSHMWVTCSIAYSMTDLQ